jgi:UDP-N-acetylglucosamine--N-acetylmuramyl-(pentapeptide) pyrophosphoryl-undecaprenol N-acetylglucosamine transferase
MIVLTGGGTGGHLEVARLLKEAFRTRRVAPIFIGTVRGQDQRWFSNDDGFSARYFLNTRGVVDRGKAGTVVSLVLVARAAVTAAGILKRSAAKAVIDVGSYAAAPASLAAVIRRIPLFIHEPSAVVSPLNRLLRPYAAGFFSSYGDASPVPDFPVDQAFFDMARPRTRVGRIIFLGGSQGARFINDFALEVAPTLRRMGIAIIHQTGEADFSRVQAGYQALNVDADTFAFESPLTPRMASADFAVSRAGGGTVWELAANGLPTLFVPFPHAARDHQYRNARFFVDRRLGFVARQSELDLDRLLSALRCDLHTISTGLMTLNRLGGAERIAEYVLNRLGR